MALSIESLFLKARKSVKLQRSFQRWSHRTKVPTKLMRLCYRAKLKHAFNKFKVSTAPKLQKDELEFTARFNFASSENASKKKAEF